MKLHYMTLCGERDREIFIREWEDSEDMEATFVETRDAVYMMPYGHYSGPLPEEKRGVRFEGSYRRHTFVCRDFDIQEPIIGGGYLRLLPDEQKCYHTTASKDFGEVPDPRAVAELVNRELLAGE